MDWSYSLSFSKPNEKNASTFPTSIIELDSEFSIMPGVNLTLYLKSGFF